MSDNESVNSIDELHELIAEYEAKNKEKSGEKTNNESKLSLEVPMDKVLFGDKDAFLNKLAEAVNEQVNDVVSNINISDNIANISASNKSKKRKPVWIDSDDEQIRFGDVKRQTRFTGPLNHIRKDKSYKDYLISRFNNIVSQPKWSILDAKPLTCDSDDEDLLRTVGFLAESASTNLPANNISCKRLKDLNRATYAEGSITSVQFHPTSTAALVAGKSGIATIYSIDGERNEKLHSMRFQNFPIKCAKLLPCGTKAIFSSTKRFYYFYDLLNAKEMKFILPKDVEFIKSVLISPCQKYMAMSGVHGNVHLFHTDSNEHIHSFQLGDSISGVSFTSDSLRLICNSKSSKVQIFSIRQQRHEHTFTDDGCIQGSALHLSPNQRLLATGSYEGVVNVYDFENVQTTKLPKPIKTFLNLQTEISDVKFNHSSELVAMCSKYVTSAIKLAHFPSGTVYKNFPNYQHPLGKITTIEFSPTSGYMATGNFEKAVPLFRLKHFNNY